MLFLVDNPDWMVGGLLAMGRSICGYVKEQGGPTAAYNLGTGRGYSVLEVIKAVEKVTGEKVPCRVGPRRPGDPAVLVASAEKAMAELGWQPRFTELEGHHCYGLAVAAPQAAGFKG